ncbi:MAG TPA: sugar phosphate isomerase/epimerase family protein [Pirellulaceae bacterium]|nr:sugar phosphate isomerase/epimerase family protein [Pirellulaceae bacterium]
MTIDRRRFVQGSSALLFASAALGPRAAAAAAPVAPQDVSLAGRLYKTLKIGMVGVAGTLTEKFVAVKAAGFDGIEMDSPGMDVEETKRAIAESGLPVDGTVCSTHWQVRHTSPDEAVRQQALADLEKAIRDTKAVGGHTVLLVIGHGNDGPEAEIRKRAIDNISKVLPLCAELGIYIAIENVWNHFLYDHQGGADQTAEKFVRFVDELNSPWVGMQFDIGNHWKYGSMGDWIRALGRRVVKLDIKGFSRAENAFKRISEGDIDYADVRAALAEIGYYGWVAAEVSGGDAAELKRIADEMDQVFRLKG